jgi:signal transduction histidine kinase
MKFVAPEIEPPTDLIPGYVPEGFELVSGFQLSANCTLPEFTGGDEIGLIGWLLKDEQTLHLKCLVDDLRKLSLAEACQLSLNLQEVDLAHLVKDAVVYFDIIAQERGIQLLIEMDEPLIHPRLDDHWMRQILHDLLSNAIRFTSEGGTVIVSAQVLQDKNADKISITDTGVGITLDELTHIFDRFNRTRGRLDSDHDRTGLGLTITKAIVEAQGGSVSAYSAGKNLGRTFTILLPL